jgi:D-xylose transport system substrate-binding protein
MEPDNLPSQPDESPVGGDVNTPAQPAPEESPKTADVTPPAAGGSPSSPEDTSTTPGVVSSPSSKGKPKKKMWPVLIAVLIVLVGAGTWLLVSNHNKPAKTASAPVIRIGLSMDTLAQSRWPQDLNNMQTYAKAEGASLTYYVADSVDATQVSQIENLIAQKVNVLIIVPHDSAAVAPTIALAHQAGIKVIAYDRIISNSAVDYYDSYNNATVGELEAQYVMAAVPKTVSVANVMLVGGSLTDPNAVQIHTATMNVLQPMINAGKVKVVYDQYTLNWDPDTANADVTSFLATGVKVNAIICANDAMADGVAAALKTAGLLGQIPLSGQDGAISAIQRLVAGTQTVSVYKPLKIEAHIAIEAAVALAEGKKPPTTTTFNNGQINVPSYLLTPEAVTKSNIQSTVIKDGFLTSQAIYGTSNN